MSQLSAADLVGLSPETTRAVLGYLRLPPVGALADAHGPLATSSNARYELSAEVRRVLGERRDQSRGLESVESLLGVDGFGPSELASIVARVSDLTRYGHRVRPLWGGPASRRALFDLIDSAERSVHIQMYIMGGEVGMELVRRLAQKAAEGVEVRLLFTASGLIISGGPSGTGLVSPVSELRSYLVNDMYHRKRMVAEIAASKIQMVDSAPIGRHWRRKSFRAQGIRDEKAYVAWARSRGIPDAWVAEQLRIDEQCAFGFTNVDHRKMILVDGERAWIGSQNLADSYLYDNELSTDARVNRARWQWHDNSAILEGGVVGRLNELFAERWTVSGGEPFDVRDARYSPASKRMGDAVVATQATVPGMMSLPMRKNWHRFLASMFGADRRPLVEGDNPIRTRLLQLPSIARHDLYAEHCYPSDADFLSQWAAGAGHLESFTMVVPRHYDTVFLGLECDRFFPEMLAAGVRLAGYNRAILHSKIAVADGWYTSTGSYNLTLRSARADLEVQFFIQCPEYGGAVRDRIRADLEECVEIAPTALDRFRSRRSLPFIDAIVRYGFL